MLASLTTLQGEALWLVFRIMLPQGTPSLLHLCFVKVSSLYANIIILRSINLPSQLLSLAGIDPCLLRECFRESLFIIIYILLPFVFLFLFGPDFLIRGVGELRKVVFYVLLQ